MKVQIRPQNNWKRWGIVGFILFGGAYASTAFSGQVPALSELTTLVNSGIAAGTAMVGGLFSSCASTISYRYRMKRAKLNNEGFVSLLVDDENPQSVINSRSTISTLDVEKAFWSIEQHVQNVRRLIKNFTAALVKSDNLTQFIQNAEELKAKYLQVHPEDKANYFKKLFENGLTEIPCEPVEYIKNKIHEITVAKQNPVDTRSPIGSAPPSPNSFSFQFSNPLLNSIGTPEENNFTYII